MNKKVLFKTLLGLGLVFSLTIMTFPLVVANWRECLNTPGCSCSPQGASGTATMKTTALKNYIVESAGYFLTSHSDYLAFLNRVEMSDINGIDVNELRDIIYSAVANMKKAKTSYAKVKKASKKIPLAKIMLDRLQKFEYDGFQSQYGLLSPIYEKVKSKLAKGDIAGLDDEVISNMECILKQLNRVKTLVDEGQSPDIAILWRINQTYVEAQLYGQYISEIIKANI